MAGKVAEGRMGCGGLRLIVVLFTRRDRQASHRIGCTTLFDTDQLSALASRTPPGLRPPSPAKLGKALIILERRTLKCIRILRQRSSFGIPAD